MKIAFRVDSSLQIGSGHVMRCLTLAEALRERGAETHFMCRELIGHLGGLIEAQGFGVCLLPAPDSGQKSLDWSAHASWLQVHWQQDANDTTEAMQKIGPVDWLVVDHYALDMNWETMLLVTAAKVMAIDDLADRPHACSLLLDQNFYADMPSRYEGLLPQACTQLLGPRYALLRSEFGTERQRLRERDGSVKQLFVFLGGSDTSNQTEIVLSAIQRLNRNDIIVDVVVGEMNPRREAIKSLCSQLPNVNYHCQVSNVAALMATADLAVTAGGSTTWERCCLGLPSLVVSTADNQLKLCAFGAEKGLFHLLGRSGQLSVDDYFTALMIFTSTPENLRPFSSRGVELVDGKGAQRVASMMIPQEIRVRLAVAEDCDSIHSWRNAEETRRHIFDSQPIPIQAHRDWYAKALKNPDRILLVGELAGQPIGVLRFDIETGQATISIFLVPGVIGRGIGTELIRAGSRWLSLYHPEVKILNAEILGENVGSIRAFERAGYTLHHLTYQEKLQ